MAYLTFTNDSSHWLRPQQHLHLHLYLYLYLLRKTCTIEEGTEKLVTRQRSLLSCKCTSFLSRPPQCTQEVGKLILKRFINKISGPRLTVLASPTLSPPYLTATRERYSGPSQRSHIHAAITSPWQRRGLHTQRNRSVSRCARAPRVVPTHAAYGAATHERTQHAAPPAFWRVLSALRYAILAEYPRNRQRRHHGRSRPA